MNRRLPSSGGGWPAIRYSLRKAQHAGFLRTLRALRSKNACKTCALGMGGQMGGMVNEKGRFPEVCKKSVQAMSADMQGAIRPGFFDEFTLDRLARLTPRELEAAGRLTRPLIARAGDDRYRPIDWEGALEHVAGRMKAAPPDETFFYFSGRSSNEAGFLLQLVARLYGTSNVNNCSFFCHQASGVGLLSVTGSGTATVTLDDLDACDLVFLIGGNPASNHPRFMRTLVDLKRRGGKVVVVNPLKEVGLVNFRVPSDLRSLLFGSPIADLYLQPNIGGDVALLYALARAVIDLDALDRPFLEAHTGGWREFVEHARSLDPRDLAARSGVAPEGVESAARIYADARRAVFCWTMGVTHHAHGVGTVRLIAALALLRGMVGRPGAGLLPLRGHSNVQGIGSVGAVPALTPAVLAALESSLGVTLPKTPGLDTLACVHRAAEGRVRFALHLGGNLYGSCPDATFAARALGEIDTTVFLSTTLNTGHALGRGRESVILPVLARDEEPEPTTQESMFNFVRMSDGGRPRHDGPRSEVRVIADIARRALGDDCPVDLAGMEHTSTIRRAIAAAIPGYGPIGEIDATRREFHVQGRTLHEPRFRTDSGRARFHVVPLPDDPPLAERELRLMTIRSEGQFNTVVYEEEDVYRGQERRDVILMHESDMRRLRVAPGDRVLVRSPSGEMAVLARPFDLPPGNAAMYYPEANALTCRVVDPDSKTPSFKHTRVTVEPARALPVRGA